MIVIPSFCSKANSLFRERFPYCLLNILCTLSNISSCKPSRQDPFECYQEHVWACVFMCLFLKFGRFKHFLGFFELYNFVLKFRFIFDGQKWLNPTSEKKAIQFNKQCKYCCSLCIVLVSTKKINDWPQKWWDLITFVHISCFKQTRHPILDEELFQRDFQVTFREIDWNPKIWRTPWCLTEKNYDGRSREILDFSEGLESTVFCWHCDWCSVTIIEVL